MQEIVVIDNYDSFTFTLVHYLEDLNCKVSVFRNDEFELEELDKYDKILLSPGPGLPSEAKLLKNVIHKYCSTKSILGVCLGHQAIGEVFGAKLLNLNTVSHGVSTTIKSVVDDEILFHNLPKEFEVGRYHSWVIDRTDFPNELEITSITHSGEIMSIRHKFHKVRGVQFHPESILTPNGKTILLNWLSE